MFAAGRVRSPGCLGALACAVALNVSPAAAQDVDGRFDVGGRAIRLECMGEGAPTVVIDAGMGAAPVEDQGWRRIAQRVVETTRVCLHDRAGLGGSDPVPEGMVRTSLDAATDLERALKAADVAGPFVLVGHSIGGLNVQVFASRFDGEVAGLVLVSSTHPDQTRLWLAEFPEPSSNESESITRARQYLMTVEGDPALNPENMDVGASNAQARALGSLGDRPVVVATHSPAWRMEPALPEELAVRLEAVTQNLQRQFLSLSSASSQTIAASAGHGLPHEDPAFVVANILQAVETVRDARP